MRFIFVREGHSRVAQSCLTPLTQPQSAQPTCAAALPHVTRAAGWGWGSVARAATALARRHWCDGPCAATWRQGVRGTCTRLGGLRLPSMVVPIMLPRPVHDPQDEEARHQECNQEVAVTHDLAAQLEALLDGPLQLRNVSAQHANQREKVARAVPDRHVGEEFEVDCRARLCQEFCWTGAKFGQE